MRPWGRYWLRLHAGEGYDARERTWRRKAGAQAEADTRNRSRAVFGLHGEWTVQDDRALRKAIRAFGKDQG
jgi:hypothetical protein